MTQPVVLVTGASSGIGAATALHLGSQGYRVILAARRRDRLEAIAKKIRQEGGVAHVIEADIGQPEQIQNLVDRSLEYFGQIDILVNSAGYGKLVWLDEQTFEEISHQIQVNLTGAILLTRAVLPGMFARGQGQIIQITSIASWIGIPTYSIYAANKFGLRGFLESLRRELRGTGVTLTGVYPGSVDTEFDQHAGIDWEFKKVTPSWLMVSPEAVARRIQRVIQRKTTFSVIPWIMVVPALINALFPRLVGWALSKYFYRSGGKSIAWGKDPE